VGYPAEKIEAGFRNRRDDVVKFLEEAHKDRYKVWNLCAESDRKYDPSVFKGNVSLIGFKDHNCPTLHQIKQFCEEASTWLDQNTENVVVVHCKAGKGRTGLMISTLLIFKYGLNYTDAINLFDQRRTIDKKGLTIPSQRRYVHYWHQIVHNNLSLPILYQKKVKLTKVVVYSIPMREKTVFSSGPGSSTLHCLLKFGGQDQEKYITSRDYQSPEPSSGINTLYEFKFDNPKTEDSLSLFGDVKFGLFHLTDVDPLCYFWFNVGFLTENTLSLKLGELDRKAKLPNAKTMFHPNFEIVLHFTKV